jgi:hypothetical protein
VTHGDFALVEIFDSEGITEGAGEILKLQDFTAIGLFVHAMEGLDGAGIKLVSDGAIGGQHELLDDAVGDVALAAGDAGYLLLFVEGDDRLGEVEVDGAIFGAAGVEKKSEAFHGSEMVVKLGITSGHLRIAFENLVDIGIGHALNGADNAGHHPGVEHASGGIEVHDGAEDEALFAGIERAHAVGESFRKHGNGAIDEVDGITAKTGLAIERRLGTNIVGNVGDVHLKEPAAVVAALDVNGVVEVAGGFAVNGNNGELAEIFPPGAIVFRNGQGETLGFMQKFVGESVGKMMLANDDFGIHTEIAGAAKYFDDAPGGRSAAARIAEEFNVDDGAVELGNMRETLLACGRVFCGGQKLFAESGREFFAGQELNVVLDARVIGRDDTPARGVAELADDGGMRAANDADNAPFGAAGAGVAAEAGDFGDDVIAVHGVFDRVARNEDVAFHIGKCDIGYNEAVAVLVENETALDFIVRGGFLLNDFLGRGFGSGGGITSRAAEKETPVGKFFDEAASLEFGEHLEEGAAVTLFHMEGTGEVLEGDRVVSKL